MTASVIQMKKALEAVAAWPYQTDKVVMLPYSEKHLAVFPEDFMGRLYYRLKKERTMHRIFPGMGVTHLNRFMAYMAKANGLVICCLKGEQYPKPIGFGWLTESEGVDGARKGAFGFGFFKEAWGTPENIDLSYMMLRYWMDDLMVDTLYGTTLKTNRLAVRYSKHFGFRYIGTLPRFFAGQDAELIVLLKEEFTPLYEAWRKKRG